MPTVLFPVRSVLPGRATRRGARVAAVLACLAVVVAGCSDRPGVAASVNGHPIAEQMVLDRTAAYLAQSGADAGADAGVDAPGAAMTKLINRVQTTDLIRHQLVLMAEADQHISVAASDVNSLISENGGAAQLAGDWDVTPDQVPDTVHNLLVLEQLLGKATDKKVPVTDVSVTVTYVAVDSRDEAVAHRTRYLADPAAIEADVAADPSSGGSGKPASLLTAPGLASAGFFSAPQGSVLITPASTTKYLVAMITKRTESKSSLSPDAVQAVSSLSERLDLVSLALTPYAAKANISVNPRFGVWDPTSLQVIAANDGL